jgi:hypothetical protein
MMRITKYVHDEGEKDVDEYTSSRLPSLRVGFGKVESKGIINLWVKLQILKSVSAFLSLCFGFECYKHDRLGHSRRAFSDCFYLPKESRVAKLRNTVTTKTQEGRTDLS